MSSQQQVVRVGVGVLIKDPSSPSKLFVGTRKGSHGAGLVALPGGHLEMYESWETCACREVLEECDLKLEKPVLAHVTNDPMQSEGKHYVTIFMMAKCQEATPCQTPKNMEPHKCEGWQSFSWEELQDLGKQGKLFGPLERLVNDNPASVLSFLKEPES